MDLFNDIKKPFRSSNIVTRFIAVNVAVFVLVRLLYVLFFLFLSDTQLSYGLKFWFFENIIYRISVPSKLSVLLAQPWSIISYMFLHYDFIHIAINMIWLYWFGKIFLMYLSSRQLIYVYLLGGIFGGVFFLLSYNIFPAFAHLECNYALGASASVMAITIAITAFSPNMELSLIFIGRIKLKYITFFYLFTDIIQIAGDNSGGHLAHLGGAMFGYFYILRLKRGHDFSYVFERFMKNVSSLFEKKKIKVVYNNPTRHETDMEYNARKKKEQEKLDKILEKIKTKGYDGLTSEEKEQLFKASRER